MKDSRSSNGTRVRRGAPAPGNSTARKNAGYDCPMDLLAVHHVAIRVADLQRAARFYREVLGLHELVRHQAGDGTDRSIWLALPGGGFLALERTTGSVDRGENRATQTGYCTLAFRIWRDQRPAVVQELLSRGAAIVHQTRWTVYIEDPEGNRIGFSHHPEDVQGLSP
jgi:glyoxylase I family protein